MSEVAASMRDDFPLLWDMAGQFDFAERLGGCSDPLLAEVDAALRELHSARAAVLSVGESPDEEPAS